MKTTKSHVQARKIASATAILRAGREGRDITIRELIDNPAFYDLLSLNGLRQFLSYDLRLVVLRHRYDWIVVGSSENAARCQSWLAHHAPDALVEIAGEEGVSVDEFTSDVEDFIEPVTCPVFYFGYNDAIGHDEQALCEQDRVDAEISFASE